jgi:hypothetical protein
MDIYCRGWNGNGAINIISISKEEEKRIEEQHQRNDTKNV